MMSRMQVNKTYLFKYNHLADTLLNKCERVAVFYKMVDYIIEGKTMWIFDERNIFERRIFQNPHR